MDFHHLLENYVTNMEILLNTGLDALKTASKKVVQKAAKATGKFIGNKIADKIVKPDKNPRNVEEIVIPPEKRKKILNELRQVL